MKESNFIGTLMPSHPDFQPIIQQIREKYQLPEVDPHGDPITEIYLGDEIIPLEDFRQEIRTLVEHNTSYLPEQIGLLYTQGKVFADKPLDHNSEYTSLPETLKLGVAASYSLAQNIAKLLIKIADNHYESITNMLYFYLLTGETEEIPADWMSQVFTTSVFGNTLIYAIASQASDPEETVSQFRALYKKTFGNRQPRLTKRIVSTAYYVQLKRMGKPWNYIVEEYIQRERISLPGNINSQRCFEVRRKAEQLLKKRMQRAEGVLSVLIGDKK